jgi:hypothetical protein
MFPLGELHTPSPNTLTPPAISLSLMTRWIQLLNLNAKTVSVHFVSGHIRPLVRCNDERSDASCALCVAGFPRLERRLTLVYDPFCDLLVAACLPGEVWDDMYSIAMSHPPFEWLFRIVWCPENYAVMQEPDLSMRDKLLSADERERANEFVASGKIDINEAVPVLTNGDMLRLPAVLDAAMHFGLLHANQASVDRSEDACVHW